MERYQRFTKQAQDAAARCYEIAQCHKDNLVDTDHFFLAFLEQPNGAVIQGLAKLNIDIAVLESELIQSIRSKWRPPLKASGIFITPEMKELIEEAFRTADRLQSQYVTTKHIFLALIGESNTYNAKILSKYGITKERVENVIEEDMSNEGQSQS
jgi:ATP-dependent Clp protease ATP-binding subunit ClpC